ncbi:glutamine--fructose-6-phosphate transaminase (isomerizing) [Devosia sp. XJ19-1]|uniref:Glutamine--fructose-6-phosphate aminotransferase [isomerizing] n=1 Tax=Devosia ureilytica TaxID=2952754 RepID=A0A9Q4APG3_9HYPH|nr:glutamine--fructose-6-phosphate transaminase (isomerizing) [Devosia ureilytica]MCP8883718.1 glutamine--fructose-6-phosphate transaminase (isomerizing) [Devosia ureilytica]MCP8887326.1 glutamine--fructose-6-phosphate transaminase (isomerizing) [Devosia ureilytica]
MCGIIGIAGREPVADRLVSALARLEYRGYDSAGIATLDHGTIQRRRAPGKLVNLANRLSLEPLEGLTGIGHTRWATHGAATETNAHPHATPRVAVVHNGIIENYRSLLVELAVDGYMPTTQTDSEVVALMVTRWMDLGLAPVAAVQASVSRLQGAFALVFLFHGEDHLLVAARQGSPLAIGYGAGEMFLGSDALALSLFTDKVTYLEEGDWAVVTPESADIRSRAGASVNRVVHLSNASSNIVEKGPYRHFMLKEIHEQPDAVSRVVGQFIDRGAGTLAVHTPLSFDFAALPRLTVSACGTAYLAGAVGKYWFERYARLPVDIDVASEFRYRQPPLEPNGLAMFISQSGETADTLAALPYCADNGQHIASVVNVEESTIARESGSVFPLRCGPEIGVASTKAFTTQLTTLACLSLVAGRARGVLSGADVEALIEALNRLPGALAEALRAEPDIAEIARRLTKARNALFLGRGSLFPIALEGALKLKEISYIHSEGYAAGELKHGPIALVDETIPVIVIAPSDELTEKTISNMQEVCARGGRIILITDAQGAETHGAMAAEIIVMPQVHPFIAPIVAAVAIQLLAYHTAVQLGADVDQPRNLAKSVTVE